MEKFKTLVLAIVIFFLAGNINSQTKIIFDTDFGGDVDDLGALCMLHNFVDKGECELLGIMCWSTEQYAVPAIDAVNRFYKHPEIPVGTRKDKTYFQDWSYGKSIADAFYNELTYEKAIDATTLYRKILAAARDKSITIITVGPLKNIENLLNSAPDSLSDLNGKILIDRKVKEFVVMGGQFPTGKNEWNFNGNMPGVTKFVLSNLVVPITFSGFEVGAQIKTGAIFNKFDHHTPLYVGFMQFSKSAPWIKEYFKGEILNNSTFDQTAVLYAVRKGVGLYWEKVENGFCQADETGGNTWIEGPHINQSYLKLKMSKEKIAEAIETFMLGDF